MSDEAVGRERFEEAYREAKAPWDIGKPQQPFVEIADQISGSVLDAGCGTGENAMFFAERGHEVVGIDFLEPPIMKARQKASDRHLSLSFRVHDALELSQLGRTFDNVIDCGLFHVFSDEDRQRYVDQLSAITHSRSTLFLLCFSDKEPGEEGPRRVSQHDLRSVLAEDWQIGSISERRFQVRHDFDEIQFSEGGPLAWFVVANRF